MPRPVRALTGLALCAVTGLLIGLLAPAAALAAATPLDPS